MAITTIEYALIRSLRQQGVLPLGGDLLELGEANWYGDVALNDLVDDIGEFAPQAERAALLERLQAIVRDQPPSKLFDVAKVFWATFLQPASMTAIDLHGGADALRLDLNRPIDLGSRFDIVLNLGTVEHVFDVAQAFETIHDHTRLGGMMIHGMPLSGWVDHGFYSFNSTFYFDVARANGYELTGAFYTQLEPLKIQHLPDREAVLRMAAARQIGENSLIYALFRRPAEARPFQAPMQAYYEGGVLSEDATEKWLTER